ncbi:hypothetical protein N1027_18325 [Herbiconiux sp. CPCC 205763]|uniref:Uncharacterized protein n=1 Tax=Herbiconiux aconitum TaxID=2970913 RepID=A0ABT2GWZ4_9MICO|nr:hypothetical protein [Herbiconiux aconitum]MCS5720092.1 hypothetical protein [Herbiconiux aconitum]
MSGTLVVVGVLVALAAVVVGLFALGAWYRRHPSRRGASAPGAGLMTAAYDEVFNPHAMLARESIDVEQRLVAPAPTPDGDRGIAGGRIRLDVDGA